MKYKDVKVGDTVKFIAMEEHYNYGKIGKVTKINTGFVYALFNDGTNSGGWLPSRFKLVDNKMQKLKEKMLG